MSRYQDHLTVSELTSKIKSSLNHDFSKVRVVGEVSNFHHHPNSGHMYFTIKDKNSEISCTMFRMQNRHLNFNVTSGLEVNIHGTVTLFEKRGQLQINVTSLEPAGIGELYRAYDKLKNQLKIEGLFDEKYKKSIPHLPEKLGIITSASSAAYQDILNVIKRRASFVKLCLYNVKVQGEGSSEQIIDGINALNAVEGIDTIIIARGGGSIEDLWSFNNEFVARSIFNSLVPIISAVGHETDFTIADFVADSRAPTPSAGAELAVPSGADLLERLCHYERRLEQSIFNLIEQNSINIFQIEKRIIQQNPKKQKENQFEKLNELKIRLIRNLATQHKTQFDRVNHLQKQLIILNPDKILERGYSVPFDQNGKIIRLPSQIDVGDIFKLKMAKGYISAKKESR
tara:strand:+ start:351 stop:1550 length:1200 start_codon:yes stop_codon:yes gene_type:complete